MQVWRTTRHIRDKNSQHSSHCKKRTKLFFAQPAHELAAIWIDHNQANLLLNDGLAHFHLGMQKEALDSFQKIDALPTKSELIRVETIIDGVLAELQREDKTQNMEWCIDRWSTGIEGAKALQSEQRFSEALTAFIRYSAHSGRRNNE